MEAVGESCQYLTFTLEEEVFALQITRVREVLDFSELTKVPQTPTYMRGVINLRGRVVPVVDMRQKFGMSSTEETVNTCIIIVEIEVEGEMTVLGALVDSVQEVIEIHSSQVEPPPRLSMRLNAEFIRGFGKQGDDFIILLNINKVFSASDLMAVEGAGSAPEAGQASL